MLTHGVQFVLLTEAMHCLTSQPIRYCDSFRVESSTFKHVPKVRQLNEESQRKKKKRSEDSEEPSSVRKLESVEFNNRHGHYQLGVEVEEARPSLGAGFCFCRLLVLVYVLNMVIEHSWHNVKM